MSKYLSSDMGTKHPISKVELDAKTKLEQEKRTTLYIERCISASKRCSTLAVLCAVSFFISIGCLLGAWSIGNGVMVIISFLFAAITLIAAPTLYGISLLYHSKADAIVRAQELAKFDKDHPHYLSTYYGDTSNSYTSAPSAPPVQVKPFASKKEQPTKISINIDPNSAVGGYTINRKGHKNIHVSYYTDPLGHKEVFINE